MSAKLGRNRNTNDTATVTSYTLNSSTATTIAIANTERASLHIVNDDSNRDVYVRMYPAADDNTKHGIKLSSGQGATEYYSMPPDNIYTGEVSAIAAVGSPTIMVTEW